MPMEKRIGMIVPLFKLGTLTVRTLSKPIAARLRKGAGLHPGFRDFIIGIAQVAGLALIYEVHRSSRSEALKEEKRKQVIEALKQKDAANMREVEALKIRLNELEQQLVKQKNWWDMLPFRCWPYQPQPTAHDAAAN